MQEFNKGFVYFVTLEKIGGKAYAEQEMQAIATANAAAKEQAGLSALFSKPFHKVLLLGIVIAVFQQWCGTNVIFNYAQEIFQSAGYSSWWLPSPVTP